MEHAFYVNKLQELQLYSKAEKRKVAAIIIDENTGNELSSGVNYNPVTDKCENDNGETFDTVIHAEESACLNLLRTNIFDKSHTLVLYCTFSPCINCCRIIAQSGIKKVYYLEEHKSNFITPETIGSLSPLNYLLQCGIEVYKFNGVKFIRRERNAIIYHSVDADGFMSGYLLNQVYDNTIMYGYNYQPEADWMNINHDTYIFGDITPPIEWLQKKLDVLKSGKVSIVIYDHHKNRIDQIKEFISTNSLFSSITIYENNYENESACRVVYRNNLVKLKGNVSDLIYIISNYDTWYFTKLDDIGEQNRIINVMNYINTVESYEGFNLLMMNLNDKTIDEYAKYGIAIGKKIERDNLSALKHAKEFKINGYPFVLYQGIPNYQLQKQLEKYYNLTDKSYICYIGYNVNAKDNTVKFSARTKNVWDDNISALDIAEMYGGGGHKDAAGFTVSLKQGFDIIENIKEIFSESFEKR